MKTNFLTIKKKTLIIILICIICVGIICAMCFPAKASASPKPQYTIVIDAGHGGIDGGCVGKKTGITESQLNLDYANELKKLCEGFGMEVTMTRSSMEGLYSPFASNKKRSEMEERERIIKKSNADMLISIHMNSVSFKQAKGAQVFYKQDSSHSKEFADDLTQSLSSKLNCIRDGSKEGDFYVLNCNNKPAVLLECGFLSNAEEEILLSQSEYRKKFCEAVFYGILNFLKM